MKKYLFLVLAMIYGMASFAQLKPERGDMGFGFKLTGLANIGFFNEQNTILNEVEWSDPAGILSQTNINSLLPQQMVFGKYYIGSKTALRFGLGGAYFNSKVTRSDSSSAGAFTSTDHLNAYSVGLDIGIEKHFGSNAIKIDPYAGIQFSTGWLGDLNFKQTQEYGTPTNSHTLQTVTYPGGWAIGGHLFAGFNYFFTSNFALGAEYSIGFDHLSMGGQWSDQTRDLNNDNTIVFSTSGKYLQSANMLRVGSTAGVNATVYF